MWKTANREDLRAFEPRVRPEMPGFLGVMGAGFQAEAVETDWWFRRDRSEGEIYDQIWRTYQGAVGEQEASTRLQEAVGRSRRGLTDWGQAKNKRALLGLLSEANENDPEPFRNLPRQVWDGPDGIRSLAVEGLRGEYQDAMETLSLSRGASGAVAEFLGRGGAAVTDQVSAVTLPMGMFGKASMLRVFAREAMIGGLSEAALLPRMYSTAEELDIEDPNAVSQIAMGAAFGGVIGAAPDALIRLVSYANLRRQARLAGVSEPEAARFQAETEAAIENDAPLPATPARQTAPKEAEVAPEGVATPESEPSAPTALPEPAMTEEEALEELRAAAPEAINAKTPLARRIRSLGGIARRTYNQATGEYEITAAAQELEARGINTRTAPWLFNNKTGRSDLDNIDPGSIFEDADNPFRLDDTGNYIDREELFDALANEIAGGQPFHTTRAAREALEVYNQRVEEAMRAANGEMQPERAVAALNDIAPEIVDEFLGVDAALARQDEIARSIDDFIARPENANVTSAERDAMFRRMEATGMDADDAFVDVATRLILDGNYAPVPRAEIEDVPFGDAGDGLRGEATGTRGSDGSAPRPDRAGDGDAAFETTDAGEQSLIPGVEPVTQRQRLEARQNAPLQGGDRPVDGLFDLGARAQIDIFDDLQAPEATRAMDSMEADARAFFAPAEQAPVPAWSVTANPPRLGRSTRKDEMPDYVAFGDNGLEIQEYFRDGRFTQNVRTPEGDIVTRGVDANGNIYYAAETGNYPNESSIRRIFDRLRDLAPSRQTDNLPQPQGGRAMDAGDGAGMEDIAIQIDGETVTARSLLDDIEADTDHLAAVEQCGIGGRA